MTLNRRDRAGLLLGTALQAAGVLVVTLPASAQPAPTGGRVVAGQASIAQAGQTTLITQASRSASIDWSSFNVGAGQAVVFRQPGSSAIALNRVTGPDPSVIAGRITANGQVVLINQSGVLFTRGSQVDTAGLVVSAAGMSDRNFAAGRLVFDRAAHPGAVVSNAGNLTVRQAGLAALVAPQVANSGLITARLGHVVLAGAETATLDLYGDRLVSLNVTGAVRAVSVGGRMVPALVTNTGTVLAPGGTVLLTARDADALVSQLVTAGGTLSADAAGRGGQVLVEGVGGSVEIAGTLSARGTGALGRGGAVGVMATGTVTLDRGASVDASGARRGGTVALGTTLARARHGTGVGPHAAAGVSIAAGATVRADATLAGAGGRIAVLGRQSLTQDGALSARAAAGGDGGSIELSGNGALAINGTENAGATAGQVGAASGHAGSILIDPDKLEVTTSTTMDGFTHLTPAEVAGMTGNVTLTASNILEIESDTPLGSGATGFLLQAGTLLVLNAAFDAGSLAGTFMSGVMGIQHTAGLVTAGHLDIVTAGSVSQTGGTLALGTLTGFVGGITLAQHANSIGTLGALTSTGAVDIATGSTLVVAGALAAAGQAVTLGGSDITLAAPVHAGTLTLMAGGAVTQTGAGTITAGTLAGSAGTITLPAGNAIGTLGPLSATGGIVLDDGQPLVVAGQVGSTAGGVTLATTGVGHGIMIAGTLSASADVSLTAAGSLSEAPGGAILIGAAGTLTARAGSGITLTGSGNSLSLLGTANAGTGAFALDDRAALGVRGGIGTAGKTLTIDAAALTLGPGSVLSVAPAGLIALASDATVLDGSTIMAPGGTVAFDRHTPGTFTIGAGATLDGATLDNIVATTLALGTADGTMASPRTTALSIGGAGLDAGGFATLSLFATGTLSGTEPVTATVLRASAGTILLEGPGSAIGTVATLLAGGGGLVLDDDHTLVVSGPVTSLGGTVQLAVTGPDHDLAIDAAVQGTQVTLTAAGGAVTDSATILATVLDASAGGSLVLDGVGNMVGTVSGLSAAGTLAFHDAQTLDIAGPVRSQAGPVALAVTGSLQSLSVGADITAGQGLSLSAADSLTLGATLSAAGATLVAGTGAITQGGGALHLGTGALTVQAGSGVALASSGNMFGTLGASDAGSGDLVVADAAGLTVTGLVHASGLLSLAVAGTGHDLQLGQDLDGGTVALAAGGGSVIEAAAYGITATTLSAIASGVLSLAGTHNMVGTLATLGAGATIDFVQDAAGVVLAGTQTAGLNATLTAASVTQSSGLASAGGTLAITATEGTLSWGGVLEAARAVLVAAGDMTEIAGTGALTATVLTGSAGNMALLETPTNSIGTLSGFVATHGLTLVDAGGLTIGAGGTSGTDGTIALTAPTITIAGTLADIAVMLDAGTGGIDASQGSVDASSLSGTSGAGAQFTGTNMVDALSTFGVATDFDLHTQGSLSIAGALDVPGLATLVVGRALTETTAGAVKAGTLTGSAAGTVVLDQAIAVGTLAGFSAGTGLTLRDEDTLVVSDVVAITGTGPGGVLSIGAPGLTLASLLDDTLGTVRLTLGAGGAIGTAGGIDAATLTGSSAGAVQLDGANAIGTLAAFTDTAGSFTLADTTALMLAGLVQAPSVALAAGGPIDEVAGGTIATALLAASSGGSIQLGAPGNMIGTVTGIGAAGRLLLVDGETLVLDGTVTAGSDATLTVTGGGALIQAAGVLGAAGSLTATATTILLGGAVSAPGQVVTLIATAGDVAEQGQGTVAAGTLTGSATGNLLLDTQVGNQVAVLNDATAGGDLSLADSVAPTLTGLVRAGQDVTLAVQAMTGTTVLAATLVAPTTLSLSSTGDVVQSGGTVTAGTLAANVAGTLSLNGGGNALPLLGAITVGGDFVLRTGGGIAVAGPLTDTGGATTLTALGGDIGMAPGGTLLLASLSGSAAPGGGLAGSLDLDAGAVRLGTLTGFSAAGTIGVTDLVGLTLAGTDVAAGDRAVLAAPSIDVAGTLALPGAGLVALAADDFAFGGAVLTPGGTIALSRLTAGVFAVGPGETTAPTLAGLRTGVSTGEVVIGSTDGATQAPATTGIALTAPLDFSGVANATGTLVLLATGDIVGTGGLAVGVLRAASPAGSIALTGPNTVPLLGALTAAGSVAFDDAIGLAVTANITGPQGVALSAAGPVTIDDVTLAGLDVAVGGASIAIGGTLSAPAGTVTLSAPGGVSEAGFGTVLAATLAGPAPGGALQDGTLDLLAATNAIGTLGALAGAGDLDLRDGRALSLAGPVVLAGGLDLLIDGAGDGVLATGSVQAGGTVLITASGLVVQSGGLLAGQAGMTLTTQGVQLAGTLRSGGTIDLLVSGGVAEAPTGSLAAGTLTGSVGGAVSLGSDLNAVGTLAGLAAGTSGAPGGTLELTDGIALTVAGPVTSATEVQLSDAQALALTGTVAGSLVVLAAAGIDQAASSAILATDLDATAIGDLRLPGMNVVATIDTLSAGNLVQVSDFAPSVVVRGPVVAGGAAELDLAGNALLLADITGGTVTVGAGGSITQGGGVVSGGAIALAAASITQAGPGSLTLSGTGTIDLAAASGDVTLAGVIDAGGGGVHVTAPGNLSETGRLAAAILSGNVHGTASVLGQAAVSELGAFIAGRTLTLADDRDLTVDGPVSAGEALQLSVGGSGTTLDLAGTVAAPMMSLRSALDIDQSAGSVSAGTLARLDAAGTISLAGTFSAPTMLIGASVSPSLVAWSGNTLATGSNIAKGQRVTAFPADDGSQPGIFVQTGSLVQTGTTFINTNGARGTLEVLLTSATGTIALASDLGLIAPTTYVFLDLGTGTASGNLVLAGLQVAYVGNGTAVPARFTGSIDGVGGTEAAGFVTIAPRENVDYQFNGCPIGSSNCVLLSPLLVPVENPVLEVSFDPPRRRRDDDELVLPNVAEEDY